MTKIKQLKSNKLFFGKWPFKLECRVKGANKITGLGVEKARDWCLGKLDLKYDYYHKNNVDKSELLKFINVIEPFLTDEIQVRAETHHFNIFCKHIVLLDSMSRALDQWVYAVHQPETQEEIDYLLDNRNQKILCDKLPHGEYKFKIILRERMKYDTRKNFLSWIKKYNDTILISKTTEHWLDGKTMYKQDPFFYIKNDSLLTMIMLYLSSDIRKVHEYVPRNTITEE
jgi:hypothetical protein